MNIYNTNGALVLSRQDITDGTVSVADLAPGIYFVKYRRNEISGYTKLIKY